MLTIPRWEAECRIMKSTFPRFKPFAVPGTEAGFHGYMVGPRTGTPYQVMIKSRIPDYPGKEPGIYIDPHPESHHWINDNRLCYLREGHNWNPAEDTFAQALTLAVKYIAVFDGS